MKTPFQRTVIPFAAIAIFAVSAKASAESPDSAQMCTQYQDSRRMGQIKVESLNAGCLFITIIR